MKSDKWELRDGGLSALKFELRAFCKMLKTDVPEANILGKVGGGGSGCYASGGFAISCGERDFNELAAR